MGMAMVEYGCKNRIVTMIVIVTMMKVIEEDPRDD